MKDPLANATIHAEVMIALEAFRQAKHSGSLKIEIHHCLGEPKKVILRRGRWTDDETYTERVNEFALDEVKQKRAFALDEVAKKRAESA